VAVFFGVSVPLAADTPTVVINSMQ
jgi:hypothetical protein